MLDLALGRLSDEGATAAEAVLRDCADCESWWRAHLAGPESDPLDQAVAEVFEQFEPPSRSRVSDKYPWAVAAVLALAASLVLQIDRAETPGTEKGGDKESLIIEEMFNGDTNNDGVVDLADVTLAVSVGAGEPESDRSTLFGAGLESGDLSDWSAVHLSTESGSES